MTKRERDNDPARKLTEIVRTRNWQALEAYCLRRTHDDVRANAKRQGIDEGELEELLQEIS